MRRYQVIRNKLKKTRILQIDREINKFVPVTTAYRHDSLEKMLQRFPLVFIKPNRGSKGYKVAAIKKEFGVYNLYHNTNVTKMKTMNEVNYFIEEFSEGKKFLVQQGIDVLKIDDRSLNVRIWVQKPYNSWKVTGITAVLAAPHNLITNYQQGGTLLSFKKAMNKTAGSDTGKVDELTNHLHFIGKRAAKILNYYYKGLRELGIDIAVDKSFWPWILEVNTKPMVIIGNPKISRYHSIIKQKYKRKRVKKL